MEKINYHLVDFLLKQGALRFGDFTLKSGRKSPYFFNAGLLYQSRTLKALGEFYAECIINASINFEILFGPAYKGIPLATATAIALSLKDKNIAVCYNRKEIKDHGEGGKIVGPNLEGKDVLIIDDVITAGTAFYESKRQIEDQGGNLTGVIIALNRQERGKANKTTIEEIETECNIPVLKLLTLNDIKVYLNEKGMIEELRKIQAHQQQYGV
jgi:orotate phosphoribosyltransferase